MDNKTTIEHFNNYLILFINDIVNLLPEYKENIDLCYEDLLNKTNCNDDKYVKRFIRKTKDYKTLISNRDGSLFENDINILKTINFKEVWNKDIGDKNKNKIWEYIQTLFVLSETIISDGDRVKKLLDNIKSEGFSNIDENKNNENDENDENDENNENNENNDDAEIMNMLKNLSNIKEPEIDNKFIDNSLIGNLAKELSSEIDMSDMNISDDTENIGDVFSNLLSGNNPMNFMNLIKSVGDKINNKVTSGDLKQEDLVNEATKMMGSLGGNNPLFKNMFGNLNQQSQNTENQSFNNPTRERLRKKLEKKNKK